MSRLDDIRTPADWQAYLRDTNQDEDEPTQRPSRRILAYIQQLVTDQEPVDPMTLTARELRLYKRGIEVGRKQVEALYGSPGDTEADLFGHGGTGDAPSH